MGHVRARYSSEQYAKQKIDIYTQNLSIFARKQPEPKLKKPLV